MLGFRLVIAAVLAFAGYRWAKSFEDKHGQRAWNLHPGVWALLFGMGLLIGVVCAALAERSFKKSAARPTVAWQPLRGQPQGWAAPPAAFHAEPWAPPQSAPVVPPPPSA
jgi:hypothetical protein